MNRKYTNKYAKSMPIQETKACDKCGESETRLDARYCCWCGTPFTVVIITTLSYTTITVDTGPKTNGR